MAGSAAGDASRSKVATVLRVTSGNFLEMFDFYLFGFYATYISRSFFPTGSEFASLMLTFMTFGAGFLMRPLGAIFLGAYVDSIGRRQGLILADIEGVRTSLSEQGAQRVGKDYEPVAVSGGVFHPNISVICRANSSRTS